MPMRRIQGPESNGSSATGDGLIKTVRIRADNVKKEVRQKADKVRQKANKVRKELEESEKVQVEVISCIPRITTLWCKAKAASKLSSN